MSGRGMGGPAAAGAPLLELESVVFGYDGSGPEALSGLSASVEEGSVAAILGPNGAGKTTLLHVALGYLKPRSGRVLYAGRELASYSRRELGREIALVPQSERIPFQYTVLEYVTLGRSPRIAPLAMPSPEDEELARQAVAKVGLEALASREVTSLSGGERQLAAIARSIAQGPRLMLMDEPMAHLDLANKARVLGIVRSLAASGTTVLFTTHEPEVAAAAASELVLVRGGRALAAGPTGEVMTAEALSRTYGLPVEVARLEGRTIALWTPREGE